MIYTSFYALTNAIFYIYVVCIMLFIRREVITLITSVNS